ncbi:MAG: hypothetical protein R3E01_25130 [Pirellulaceae bacterium]
MTRCISGCMVVHPRDESDELWALDQILRCSAVGSVWCCLPRLSSRDFRRLQLAAEQGGVLGMLVRPERVRGQPSWAEMQWLVQPLPAAVAESSRRWRLQLVRCRGGVAGGSLEVWGDESTGELQVDRWVSDRNMANTLVTNEGKVGGANEAGPLCLATELARPAANRRAARA